MAVKVQVKLTVSLTVHVLIIDFVRDLLVLLSLLSYFFEGTQCTIKTKKSLVHRSTVILDQLPHLVVLNNQENVDLAQLRYFYRLLDECLLALALKIDALEFIINGLFFLFFYFSIVHRVEASLIFYLLLMNQIYISVNHFYNQNEISRNFIQ